MKKPAFYGVLIMLIAMVAMYLAVRGVNIPVLNPAGPIAASELWIIYFTLAMSGIIVIPVFFLLFYFAWKYRSHAPLSHVHHRPNWDHDNPIAEFIWWLVPAAIIATIAVVSWNGSHALDPFKPLNGAGRTL